MNWIKYWNFLNRYNIYLLLLLLSACSTSEETETKTLCILSINVCSNAACNRKEKKFIGLVIQEEASAPYKRSEFLNGTSWIDSDGDCQDTRAEILVSSSLLPTVKTSSGCKVVMGLWIDPYTDSIFEDAGDLDIDHIVPLKEAHESGAANWDKVKRINFANDYQKSKNLLPVWNSVNRSKGSRDPTEWLPPNHEYHCEYLDRWSKVKSYWNLFFQYKRGKKRAG